MAEARCGMMITISPRAHITMIDVNYTSIFLQIAIKTAIRQSPAAIVTRTFQITEYFLIVQTTVLKILLFLSMYQAHARMLQI